MTNGSPHRSGSTSRAAASTSPRARPRWVAGWCGPRRRTTSRGRCRCRRLIPELARACEGKKPGDLVFTAPGGGPLRLGNWRTRVFDPACAAAGIVGLTPHDLRHTAASLAIAAGANVKAVQRMLGHSSAADDARHLRGPVRRRPGHRGGPAGFPCATNAPQRRDRGATEAAMTLRRPLTCGNVWWGRSGLNRRPTDYESAALTD